MAKKGVHACLQCGKDCGGCGQATTACHWLLTHVHEPLLLSEIETDLEALERDYSGDAMASSEATVKALLLIARLLVLVVKQP